MTDWVATNSISVWCSAAADMPPDSPLNSLLEKNPEWRCRTGALSEPHEGPMIVVVGACNLVGNGVGLSIV